jgi:hypothetical protein
VAFINDRGHAGISSYGWNNLGAARIDI